MLSADKAEKVGCSYWAAAPSYSEERTVHLLKEVACPQAVGQNEWDSWGDKRRLNEWHFWGRKGVKGYL